MLDSFTFRGKNFSVRTILFGASEQPDFVVVASAELKAAIADHPTMEAMSVLERISLFVSTEKFCTLKDCELTELIEKVV